MLRKLENQTQVSSMLDLWATFLSPPPQTCPLWCGCHLIGEELTDAIEHEVSFVLLISSPLPLRKSSSESVDFPRRTFHTELNLAFTYVSLITVTPSFTHTVTSQCYLLSLQHTPSCLKSFEKWPLAWNLRVSSTFDFPPPQPSFSFSAAMSGHQNSLPHHWSGLKTLATLLPFWVFCPEGAISVAFLPTSEAC